MALPETFPMQIAGGKTLDVPAVGFGTWASGWLGASFIKHDNGKNRVSD